MQNEEDYFPRGGRKVKGTLKRPKEDDNLFSQKTKEKSKKPKKDKKSRKEILSEDTFHSNLNIRSSLSYNTIRSGMLILGCVRGTTSFSIEVELPGLTFGHVKIINISDSFTKYLSEKLKEQNDETETVLEGMFKVGQFVLVKVLDIENNKNGSHIECTLNPREIYSEKSHNSFEKGMLVWASVHSVLDHGFELSLGIKNCRVFLPSKNVDEGRNLVIGETFWCTIHKCDSSSAATTLRVSCKDQHLKSAKIEEIKSLDDLLPGMQIDLLVEKINPKSIEGKFLNDYFGFIEENQLKEPLKQTEDYKEGKLITAYVLYVDHPTKVTYLTLRSLEIVSAPTNKIGDIKSGQVISKAYNGIYLKLPSEEKGFVTNKRLLNSLPKSASLDISDTISLKFGQGTRHTCRILDYNHLARVFICTVEQSLVKEKVFSSSDLQIGQMLNVKVESVKDEGLVVSSGHIQGFVPNLFLTNAKYSVGIKKKFQEGFKAKARVLNIDDGNVIFTMKPSQVESEKCLTDLSLAKRGDQYTGVVIQLKSVGALVLFYGNIKGWMSRNYLGDRYDKEKPDPTQYFYQGQVINPWVLGVATDKVILGLNQPAEFRPMGELRIGERVSGVVSKVLKDRIEVSAKGRPIGSVPLNHLGAMLPSCPALMKTFEEGRAINDLICIRNKPGHNLLSRREALKKCARWKLRKFEQLRSGNVIRCSYLSECETGIKVLPLISNYTEEILIRNEDIVEKGKPLPKFEEHQSIVAKILEINQESNKIHLTIKFSETFDKKVKSVLAYFKSHLNDVDSLRTFGREHDWDLCCYQPGERIDCRIEQLGEKGGCLVRLPNGAPGLVAPRLCPAKVKVGTSITGVFLSQNFKDNYAEICLKQDICDRINKVQDGSTKIANFTSCFMETLIIKPDHVLGVLKQDTGNRQLVYIPLHLHENDLEGCKSFYEQNRVKIYIIGNHENYLIGMSKKQFVSLDHAKVLISKEKRKRIGKTEAKVDDAENSDTEVVNGTDAEQIESQEEEEETSSENEEGGVEVSETDEDEEVEQSKQTGVKRKMQVVEDDHKDADHVKHFRSESEKSDAPAPLVSGVSSFFAPESKMEQESSSDEEEETAVVKKKKKLTPEERANLAREEEDRISKIERELADSTKAPETAEQFDRKLLANPNSSELWTQYIAFHTAATEFDKARAVAKRALESINLTLINERFNIWIALLNLENMLGNQKSFDQTFNDALIHNDSLQVYLKTIQMLAEAGKFADMEEKIHKVRSKHKQEPTMWLEVAKVYYGINRFKDARNLKDASLKSIADKKTQMEIIVRFAIMEFKFGEEEQGAAIFETILTSDPRKVNVWSIYVDQLVKKNKIEEARKVLERSVCQRLPLKSMKSLFLKYRMFEEQHGTPETVEAVKEKAKEYAAKMSKN